MTAAARQAVFLDRDGVLNRAIVRNGKPYPPASLTELHILPGTADALAALKSVGFLLIGVTNQPDVARGSQRREVVEAAMRIFELTRSFPREETYSLCAAWAMTRRLWLH